MSLVKNHFSVVCIALLLSAAVYAQEFQGKAYYFSKTSVDMDSWGGRKMSEDQKNKSPIACAACLKKPIF
jgi:hypothetical protein